VTTGRHPHPRRSLAVVLLGVLALVLSACNGRGGGQLPPDSTVSDGSASFGFTFSCEDSGGLNARTGQLRIQLSYTERGTSLIGPPFSIHGTADVIDPVLESQICAGQNPPPGGNELIFLGRYRLTSSSPTGFPSGCAAQQTSATPPCRFEVIVRDNDRNGVPSTRDYFHIALSSGTAIASTLDPGTVVYTRAGLLSSGNLTVD
jgi:hypothetical protein